MCVCVYTHVCVVCAYMRVVCVWYVRVVCVCVACSVVCVHVRMHVFIVLYHVDYYSVF